MSTCSKTRKFNHIKQQTNYSLRNRRQFCIKPMAWDKCKGMDVESFCELLVKGDLTVSVDESFPPTKSSLVSAHFVITYNERKLGSSDFISIVALIYRNDFAVESCGVLAICKLIKHTAQRRRIERLIRVNISSDCAAVMSFLHCTRSTISNKATLYQIKREILLIKEKINSQISMTKVASHHDEIIPFNKSSFLEKVNTICDRKAKCLIQSETRGVIPFPFELSSPYI